MDWKYTPAKGTAGGMLVGFRNLTIEVISWQEFEFYDMAIVNNVEDKFVCRLITIYESSYEDRKLDFLKELGVVINKWQGPTLAG
jgi:hypothetical protein